MEEICTGIIEDSHQLVDSPLILRGSNRNNLLCSHEGRKLTNHGLDGLGMACRPIDWFILALFMFSSNCIVGFGIHRLVKARRVVKHRGL